MNLRLDWCSYNAVKYACKTWHYSKSVPAGKLVKIGVWENDVFIGVILFGRGASNAIGKPYGLKQTEICELVRVALTTHETPVSRILAIALRMLAKNQPGLRLIVSYADPSENHHGGIYQATNWLYAGDTKPDFAIIDKNGKRWHSRMVSTTGYKTSFGIRKKTIKPSEGKRVTLPGKHKYLYPLDKAIRKQIAHLAQPYPKRASEAGDDPVQGHSGGATPTPTLQPQKETK